MKALFAMDADCLLCGAAALSPLCVACDHALPLNGTAVCPQCAAQSPDGLVCGDCLADAPAFDAARAAFQYAFPLDQLIARYKYGARLAIAPVLGDALAHVLDATGVDLVVPVPLSSVRLAERGFNQSGLLAARVADRLKLKLDHGALQRVIHTAPQVGLDWKSRRANMRRAFVATGEFAGKTIALVDDVVTTGATMDAAAQALKAAGALRVVAWAVARADHFHADVAAF